MLKLIGKDGHRTQKKLLENSHSLEELQVLVDCNLSAGVLYDPKNKNDQRYLDYQIYRLPGI